MLIVLSAILLLAYVFDITSAKTRIPTVVWLILLGFGLREWSIAYELTVPNLGQLLPLLGTVGLILIVLEGSLELELNQEKVGVLWRTSALALVGMLGALAALSAIVYYLSPAAGWHSSILNSIPLCVISSAIAVPSVQQKSEHLKEFVIYETSLSDIIGVLLFNFVVVNTTLAWSAMGGFALDLVVIMLLSAVATVGLSLLLSLGTHPVKFIPIMIMVVLIYAIEKHYHLPALIFVLVFGLFLGNFHKLKLSQRLPFFKPDVLKPEVAKLHDFLREGAFVIRSLFFALLGFTLDRQDLLNLNTVELSVAVVAVFVAIRAALLLLMRQPLVPLLFIAPRGLITILLFISIPAHLQLSIVDSSLVVQVILLMVVLMTIGLMFDKSTPAVEHQTA